MHLKTHLITGAVLAVLATPALANPMAAAGADALAAAAAQAGATGGDGIGTGGDATGGSSTSKSKTDGTVAAALGQAPSALSAGGICGKDNRFAFGALQWSDYSSKCFNYQIAIIAAQTGNWTLANQWVRRADGM